MPRPEALPPSGFAGLPAPRRSAYRAALLRELGDPDILDRMELHYQPIRCVETGRVLGAEALARWNRGTGLLPAADFIGLAVASGRLPALERWSLEQALRECGGWCGEGWDGWIAMNLSGASLTEPGFPGVVRRLLDETEVPPGRVIFEVTETGALGGNGVVRRVLEDLRALGTRIALDDFGTGYANFGYLRDFDPHVIKLDRAFVSGDRDAGATRLLTALVDFAHALEKPVVVEGVERHAEWERAVDCGADLVQGYLTGRPVAGPDFISCYLDSPEDRAARVEERAEPVEEASGNDIVAA